MAGLLSSAHWGNCLLDQLAGRNFDVTCRTGVAQIALNSFEVAFEKKKIQAGTKQAVSGGLTVLQPTSRNAVKQATQLEMACKSL